MGCRKCSKSTTSILLESKITVCVHLQSSCTVSFWLALSLFWLSEQRFAACACIDVDDES